MATQSRRLFTWLGKQFPTSQSAFSRFTEQFQTNTTEVDSTRADVATLLSNNVTVIIPALNEQERIASVVTYALSDPATAQVIVIDDSSIDDTVQLARAAGATVYTSSMLGKGGSMKDGLAYVKTPYVAYLDGDLAGLEDHIISRMCSPLANDEADFVKAKFGRSSGRVTELTAKPMIKVFFPELAYFAQPLGGMIAARTSLLQSLNFEDGYGVDIGLLIDAHLAQARLTQVDIGSLEHDSQSLNSLALMAAEIGRVIFNRAKTAGRLNVDQISAMYEAQRQSSGEIDFLLSRRAGRKKLFLLSMDSTVTATNFCFELARASGQLETLNAIEKDSFSDPTENTKAVAKVFQFVHKKKFEEVAVSIALRADIIELVNQLRREGFMVGVISDGFNIAAEIIRKRIFADFSIDHYIEFTHEVCTGNVRVNAAFLDPLKPDIGPVCKSNVVKHFELDDQSEPLESIWAIGNQLSDLPLLKLAHRAFTIAPSSTLLANNPQIEQIDSYACALLKMRANKSELRPTELTKTVDPMPLY